MAVSNNGPGEPVASSRHRETRLNGSAAIAASRCELQLWRHLVDQLAVFVAWAGLVKRFAALHDAVHAPSSPCGAELLLCAFSAWVMQVCVRRGRTVMRGRARSGGDGR